MRTETTDARGGMRGRAGGVLGSLSRLRSDPLGLFTEAASDGEDLVRFRAAHRSVFLAVGPDAIAHVGIHNRENYVKGVSYEALRVPIRDALLTIDGEAARGRRRLLMPLFTRRTLEDEVPTMASAVEALCERWDGFAATGATLDLASEMNRLAFDVVGRVLMGAEVGEDMGGLEALIAEASEWVARRTRAVVPLPVAVPTRRNVAFTRARRAIRAFADRLIASRRDAARDDVVSRLLEARDEDGRPLRDEQVRDEVIGFLMAGHQTTGAALAWTWYLLALNPEAQDRVALGSQMVTDGGRPTAWQLDLLLYLGQVLEESMRLYPPGWAFTRTPLADDVVAGRRVPAGSVVVISSYANQHSPRFWDRPEAFEPERFEPGRREAIGPYDYFPFGVGPHVCIGKLMAELEAKIALAMLARRYRLRLVSSRPVPPVPAITLTPGAPIPMRVELRA